MLPLEVGPMFPFKKKTHLAHLSHFYPFQLKSAAPAEGRKALNPPLVDISGGHIIQILLLKVDLLELDLSNQKHCLLFFTQLVVVFCFSGDCFFLYYSSNIKSVLF